MNIAIMSHTKKQELMMQFCTAYCGVLSKHSVCGTNATGRMVAEATGLPVQLFLSHEHGGRFIPIFPKPIIPNFIIFSSVASLSFYNFSISNFFSFVNNIFCKIFSDLSKKFQVRSLEFLRNREILSITTYNTL